MDRPEAAPAHEAVVLCRVEGIDGVELYAAAVRRRLNKECRRIRAGESLGSHRGKRADRSRGGMKRNESAFRLLAQT